MESLCPSGSLLNFVISYLFGLFMLFIFCYRFENIDQINAFFAIFFLIFFLMISVYFLCSYIRGFATLSIRVCILSFQSIFLSKLFRSSLNSNHRE